MKTIVYVLLGLLVSLPVWSTEPTSERINAEELREISQKRKVVTIISNDGNKLKLINKLLDTEGYVSHQLNYFADILRIQDKLNNTNINSGFRYREFVRNEIRNNTPFDEFVQKLIASEGAYYESGNEPIGFYVIHVENCSRLFGNSVPHGLHQKQIQGLQPLL